MAARSRLRRYLTLTVMATRANFLARSSAVGVCLPGPGIGMTAECLDSKMPLLDGGLFPFLITRANPTITPLAMPKTSLPPYDLEHALTRNLSKLPYSAFAAVAARLFTEL